MLSDDGEDVSFGERRSAFNKFTGEGVNCCAVNIDKKPSKLEGQIYKFPFDVEKKTYKVFNSTAGMAFDADSDRIRCAKPRGASPAATHRECVPASSECPLRGDPGRGLGRAPVWPG